MRTIICLFLCALTGCANVQNPSPEAVKKNNQAIEIVLRSANHPDSIKKVVNLLDEAIAIDPSYELAYSNKVQYLMILGNKEKALETLLQIEKLSPKEKDPVFMSMKGMLLEVNDKMELASEAYKQSVSLFEARLNKKPVEADLMNYYLALYLRDNKKYSLDEVEKKYPNVLQDSVVREFMIDMENSFDNNNRAEFVYEMAGGQ